MKKFWIGVIASLILIPAFTAQADVLCKRRHGALVVRDECRSRETQIDPVALGLQGPQGEPGLDGDPGLQGEPGVCDLSDATPVSAHDDFNDGNFDGWFFTSGHGIGPNVGNWRVENGVVVEDLGTDQQKLLLENYNMTSQSIEANLLFLDNGYAGIALWWFDAENWIDVTVFPGHRPDSLRIIEQIDGIQQTYVYPLFPNQFEWYAVRVDANSSSGEIDVYVNGAYIATHSAVTPHRSGLSGFESGNGGGKFDDFKVIGHLR